MSTTAQAECEIWIVIPERIDESLWRAIRLLHALEDEDTHLRFSGDRAGDFVQSDDDYAPTIPKDVIGALKCIKAARPNGILWIAEEPPHWGLRSAGRALGVKIIALEPKKSLLGPTCPSDDTVGDNVRSRYRKLVGHRMLVYISVTTSNEAIDCINAYAEARRHYPDLCLVLGYDVDLPSDCLAKIAARGLKAQVIGEGAHGETRDILIDQQLDRDTVWPRIAPVTVLSATRAKDQTLVNNILWVGSSLIILDRPPARAYYAKTPPHSLYQWVADTSKLGVILAAALNPEQAATSAVNTFEEITREDNILAASLDALRSQKIRRYK